MLQTEEKLLLLCQMGDAIATIHSRSTVSPLADEEAALSPIFLPAIGQVHFPSMTTFEEAPRWAWMVTLGTLQAELNHWRDSRASVDETKLMR